MVVLRDVVQTYPEVRVILMSATIDTSMFQDYFFNCPVIEVHGRTFDVQGRAALSCVCGVWCVVCVAEEDGGGDPRDQSCDRGRDPRERETSTCVCVTCGSVSPLRVLPGGLHPDDQLRPAAQRPQEEGQGRGGRRRGRKETSVPCDVKYHLRA